MKLAYYFDPNSPAREKYGAPSKVYKVEANIDFKTLDRNIERLWTLIRENEVRWGIPPLAVISASDELTFDSLCAEFEYTLLPNQQVEDISNGKKGWGLGW